MRNFLFILICFLFCTIQKLDAQMVVNQLPGNLQRCMVVNGDTLILVQLRNVYCFPKKVFKSAEDEKLYWRMVRDVKKTLPLAKLIHGIMMETYEYIETLPSDKLKDKHLKKMQNDLFEEYKPVLKQLTYSQGKMLIKLIERECKSSSYELIKAYLGSFAAGFWQGFGKLFGVSLRTEWDPDGRDREINRICFMVEYGAI